jgi:septum formation protein
VLDGELIGKPADAGQSRAHLLALSGRTHRVISAVEVVDEDGVRAGLGHADVRFRELDEALVDWYLATGEGDDKAGAYALQGAGAALVERVDGHPSTVIGLPVGVVLDLLPGLLSPRAGS